MIYEYKCKCGKVTEIVKSMRDIIPDKVLCEHCNNEAFRVFSSNIKIPPHMKATGRKE